MNKEDVEEKDRRVIYSMTYIETHQLITREIMASDILVEEKKWKMPRLIWRHNGSNNEIYWLI